jgi:hypothetical protein
MPSLLLLLQRKGVSGYIFDLRDNPGGLVKAGMDIARLLMDGTPTVFSIVGRADEPEQKVRVVSRAYTTEWRNRCGCGACVLGRWAWHTALLIKVTHTSQEPLHMRTPARLLR